LCNILFNTIMSPFLKINYTNQKISFIPHDIDVNLSNPVFRNGKFYFSGYPKSSFLNRVFFRHLIEQGPINFIFLPK
jgi:hypothetical protein